MGEQLKNEKLPNTCSSGRAAPENHGSSSGESRQFARS